MIFSLAQQWFGIICVFGLLWLHHTQSLVDVTKATNACNLLQGKNNIKTVMLPWLPGIVF
jgi:hypothetical protein